MPKPPLSLLLFVAAHFIAAAQITPILQDRTVDSAARASGPLAGSEAAQNDAAVDFGPFLGNAESSVFFPLGAGTATSQGIGLQDSTIGATRISATGQASLSLALPVASGGLASADAASNFELTFTIPNPGTVVFSGSVSSEASVSAGASVPFVLNTVRLIDATSSAVLSETLTADEDFLLSGPLNAGTYQILASASVEAAQNSSASFERSISALSSYNFTFDYTVIGVPGTGSGQTYFVDYADGSDTADGLSPSTAWQHVPGDMAATGVPAVTLLSRGDTVRFRGGVVYYGKFVCSRSGGTGDPIVYDGNHDATWGVGRAVLDGQYLTPGTPAIKGNANVRNITIQGFEIRNVGGYADDDPILTQTLADGAITNPVGGVGIRFASGGNFGLRLENLLIHRVGQWRNQQPFSGVNSITGTGIHIENCTNVLIKNCDIGKTKACIGIKATTTTEDVVVEGCDFHNHFVWGIDVAVRKVGATFSNITIRECTFRDYHMYDDGRWLGGGESPHADGIIVRTAAMGSTWQNIRIHGCRFYDDAIGAAAGGTASIYLSQGPSALIYNNLFIQDKNSRAILIGGWVPDGSPMQVVRILNNTFYNVAFIGKATETRTARQQVHISGNIFNRNTATRSNVMIARESGMQFTTLNGNLFWNPSLSEAVYFIQKLPEYVHLSTAPSARQYGFEVTGKYTNPLFVKTSGVPSAKNLRLQASSPAKLMSPNFSQYFTDDYDGTPRPSSGPWTAGAFQ